MEDKIASAKKFNDEFRKAYGGAVPSDYGALGYAGIRSVLQAVKNADATDSTRVSIALRQLKYDWYKGAAVLPQVRPPVGAVGGHRREQVARA